jgi:excisionase family DNA binding protein
MKTEPLTITVDQAAELLGIGRSSAYQAARTGELPTVRIGRRLLVPRARLLALIGADPSFGGHGVAREEVVSSTTPIDRRKG